MLSAYLLSILKQMGLLLKECCFNMSMALTKGMGCFYGSKSLPGGQ